MAATEADPRQELKSAVENLVKVLAHLCYE